MKIIYIFKARFGEVGGNTLGYYGCSFSACGNALIAHGYHGSFQLWIKDEQVKFYEKLFIMYFVKHVLVFVTLQLLLLLRFFR